MKTTQLPRLPRLQTKKPHLPQAARTQFHLPPVPHRAQLSQPLVVPPFQSSWEVSLNKIFLSFNPYWQAQVNLGRVATIPDWTNVPLRLFFYLDGPVHAFRFKTAHDDYLRAVLASTYGGRVLAWSPPTVDYMLSNARAWYMENVGQ